MRTDARVASRSLITLVLAAVLAATTLLACASTGGSVQVTNAWVRATSSKDQPSAAYFVVTNGTRQDDALTAAATPVAANAEVHETMNMSGMTSMQHVEKIAVPANGKVDFAPGGKHVMLMNLTSPLTVGSKVDLTLTFEKAGKITVQAEVRATS